VSNPAHLFDEFDGALDEAEVDNEGEQEIKADESDEASEPKRQKKAKKVRSQHRSFTDHN